MLILPCDITQADWTIIQQRVDNELSYGQVWDMFRSGFGSPESNFWLGLDMIHVLTKSARRLRIQMTRNDGEMMTVFYDSFSVGSEASQFTLQISGYSGTAGDHLGPVRGMKFSARDRDNDGISANCAFHYKSGWWFSKSSNYDCISCNLNGVYGSSQKYGIYWGSNKGLSNMLTYVNMAIL